MSMTVDRPLQYKPDCWELPIQTRASCEAKQSRRPRLCAVASSDLKRVGSRPIGEVQKNKGTGPLFSACPDPAAHDQGLANLDRTGGRPICQSKCNSRSSLGCPCCTSQLLLTGVQTAMICVATQLRLSVGDTTQARMPQLNWTHFAGTPHQPVARDGDSNAKPPNSTHATRALPAPHAWQGGALPQVVAYLAQAQVCAQNFDHAGPSFHRLTQTLRFACPHLHSFLQTAQVDVCWTLLAASLGI